MTSTTVDVSEITNLTQKGLIGKSPLWSCESAKVHLEVQGTFRKPKALTFFVQITANKLIAAWHLGCEAPKYRTHRQSDVDKIRSGEHIAQDLKQTIRKHKQAIVQRYLEVALEQSATNLSQWATQKPLTQLDRTGASKAQHTIILCRPVSNKCKQTNKHRECNLDLALTQQAQTSELLVSQNNEDTTKQKLTTPETGYSNQSTITAAQPILTVTLLSHSPIAQLRKNSLTSHSTSSSIESSSSEREKHQQLIEEYKNAVLMHSEQSIPNCPLQNDSDAKVPKPPVPVPIQSNETVVLASQSLTEEVTPLVYNPTLGKGEPMSYERQLKAENAKLRLQVQLLEQRHQQQISQLQQQVQEQSAQIHLLNQKHQYQKKQIQTLQKEVNELITKNKSLLAQHQSMETVIKYCKQQQEQLRLSQIEYQNQYRSTSASLEQQQSKVKLRETKIRKLEVEYENKAELYRQAMKKFSLETQKTYQEILNIYQEIQRFNVILSHQTTLIVQQRIRKYQTLLGN